MSTPRTNEVLHRLYRSVRELLEATIAIEDEYREDIAKVPADRRASARNLVHYLAVRRHDIRALQIDLRNLGLSSLGRLEAHVSAALEAVLTALVRMSDEHKPPEVSPPQASLFREGNERLVRNTAELLGQTHTPDARVRIMVTMPTEAATDYELVRRLITAGMDVARINSAHDSPADWQRMAENIRAAAAECGRIVRILVDLAGPKLRTGAVEPGPAVRRIRPVRDIRGVVLEPGRARFVAALSDNEDPDRAEIPVGPDFLSRAQVGDELRLRDASGRRRRLQVVDKGSGFLTATARHAIRFETGLAINAWRGKVIAATSEIRDLPNRPGVVLLEVGDVLRVTASPAPGHSAECDDNGIVLRQAAIPCSLPEVLGQIQVGDRILFDDGVIAGAVETAAPDALGVRITGTRRQQGKLRCDKGINLPDSALAMSSLTDTDRAAFDVAARIADMVGLSFVRDAGDLESLYTLLKQRGAEQLGVVVKIETARGFENLPKILLTALRHAPVGVMVARGDLGVELGFERMAEVQEEVLWLCEAAHVPVIWATQVLEGLLKTGIPTRSEVTDAAMSARAECVMLNKGPHVDAAVRFLDDVLSRMLDHHSKKTPMLRRLKVSEGRWDTGEIVADQH